VLTLCCKGATNNANPKLHPPHPTHPPKNNASEINPPIPPIPAAETISDIQSMYQSLLFEYDYEIEPSWVSHVAVLEWMAQGCWVSKRPVVQPISPSRRLRSPIRASSTNPCAVNTPTSPATT